jgi:hypothetical protein
VSPVQPLGRFNSFAKSEILRINEAGDLGEVHRFSLYASVPTMADRARPALYRQHPQLCSGRELKRVLR